MFNFFSEIKKNFNDINTNYNIVNVSGRILYIEGHLGLTLISDEKLCFKVKNGRILVEGKGLILSELSENTLKISGEIQKVEVI